MSLNDINDVQVGSEAGKRDEAGDFGGVLMMSGFIGLLYIIRLLLLYLRSRVPVLLLLPFQLGMTIL